MGDNKRMANDTELKTLVKGLSDVLVLVADVSKGFNFKEISELFAIVDDAKAIVATKDLIIPEWEGMDEGARQDLAAYISVNVKLPVNTTVEMYAQKVLKVAVALSAAYQALVA